MYGEFHTKSLKIGLPNYVVCIVCFDVQANTQMDMGWVYSWVRLGWVKQGS